jgi:4'-phosphopantetheinyl transferase EntD
VRRRSRRSTARTDAQEEGEEDQKKQETDPKEAEDNWAVMKRRPRHKSGRRCGRSKMRRLRSRSVSEEATEKAKNHNNIIKNK